MDKNFEIELSEEKIEDTTSVQLPMNFLTFGEIEKDDVKVYIKQDTYKALEKLSSSDTSKELGSIIIGDYCQELGNTNVVISDFIEAKYTDASASTLTFTHETWDYIYSEHEKLYSDKKIIGWQHTHPNYGVFLSNYDIFIQENFFNLPFQIAYVIDPIQNIRGFFQWKNGKIEKLKGYYIYDDVGKPIKIEQIKINKNADSVPRTSKLVIALLFVLCIVCLLLGGALISLEKDNMERMDNQEKIVADINGFLENQDSILKQQEDAIVQQENKISQQENVIAQQKDTIEKQGEVIAELEKYFAEGILDTTNKTALSEIILMLENQEIKLGNQEKTIEELKKLLGQLGQAGNEVEFVSYLVKEGDSISSICANHKLDYVSNIQLIMAINGIENPDIIYVGQNLLLPSVRDVVE